jgi:hypothetical protein
MQENIRNWLELDGDPGFQLLTEEEIASLIFTSTTYIIEFSIFFLSLGLSFASLIRMTPPQN